MKFLGNCSGMRYKSTLVDSCPPQGLLRWVDYVPNLFSTQHLQGHKHVSLSIGDGSAAFYFFLPSKAHLLTMMPHQLPRTWYPTVPSKFPGLVPPLAGSWLPQLPQVQWAQQQRDSHKHVCSAPVACFTGSHPVWVALMNCLVEGEI